MHKQECNKPLRKAEVLSRELDGEVVIYDLATLQSHCLEPMAACIWQKCDGENTVAEIAAQLEVAEDVVALAVRRLEKAGLMETPRFAWSLSISRRELIKHAALAGGLAVFTTMLPTPAEAASLLGGGSVCVTSAQCNGGCCCKFAPGNYRCTVTATCLAAGGGCQ